MAAITPNMGLTQWNSVNDNFNHSALSANFAAIDVHNHTGSPSSGVQIPTGGLVNLAVSAAKLAADSVITAKILDANVTTPKLANQSVVAAKIGVLPRSRVYHNIAQTIPNNTVTALAFNAERFDTDNMHDPVTNNSFITCKTAGTYLLGATIQWAVNTTGTRQVSLRLNGTIIIASQRTGAFAVDDVHQSLSTVYTLAVNDYIEVVVRQTSGVGLDIMTATQYSPEVFAAFMSN